MRQERGGNDDCFTFTLTLTRRFHIHTRAPVTAGFIWIFNSQRAANSQFTQQPPHHPRLSWQSSKNRQPKEPTWHVRSDVNVAGVEIDVGKNVMTSRHVASVAFAIALQHDAPAIKFATTKKACKWRWFESLSLLCFIDFTRQTK